MMPDLGRIQLVLSDVDGVLTNGLVILDDAGRRLGTFSVRDGLAVDLARAAGLQVGLVTGAASGAVRARAAELGIRLLRDGVGDKAEAVRELLREAAVEPVAALFLGDDLNDLAAFGAVGVSVAVADAVPEVRARAEWVTRAAGGQGALREVVEAVLRARGDWERALGRFGAAPGAVRGG